MSIEAKRAYQRRWYHHQRAPSSRAPDQRAIDSAFMAWPLPKWARLAYHARRITLLEMRG